MPTYARRRWSSHDHGTLIRRYGIEGILDCWRSRYQECRRSGTQGKRLAREAGDVYVFVLFNVLESTALIHLGEWRELQRETTTALELATKCQRTGDCVVSFDACMVARRSNGF
jgi:hypothetical protein